MSFHVYIAKPGRKNEPISNDEWIEAAKSLASSDDAAVYLEHNNQFAGRTEVQVSLQGSKAQTIGLTPYGLLHAQDPGIDLIKLMFLLAEELGAEVISERNKAYTSLEDWKKRTRQYRNKRDEGRAAATRRQRLKALLFIGVIIVSVIIGLFVGSDGG